MKILKSLRTFSKWSSIFIYASTYSVFTYADDDEQPKYDQQLLKKLGINPNAIKQIEQNSIPSGEYLVDISVNDKIKTKQWVKVINGEVIKDRKLFSQLLPGNELSNEQIDKINTQFHYKTGRLDIEVPNQLFDREDPVEINKDLFAILNYESNYFKSDQSDSNLYVYFQGTVNYLGWSLINNFFYTSTEEEEQRFKRNHSYIKREFSNGREFQIGEISTENSLFSGLDINGLQYMPSRDYINLGTSQSITGFTATPATIEIYQNNNIIYSKNVPAGTYEINDVPVDASSRFVIVRVITSDGQVTEKPYSLELKNNQSGQSWYSFAMGHSDAKDELLVTATYDYQLKNINYKVGGLASANYFNFSAGYEQRFDNSINLHASIYSAFSYNFLSSETGVTANLQLNGDYHGNIFSLSQTYYSEDYGDYLYETPSTTLTPNIKLKSSTSLSLSKSLVYSINGSIGYAQDTYYSDDNNQRFFASINRQFSYFSVGMFYQQSDNDTSINLTVSVPLGKRGGSISSTFTQSDIRKSVNTYYSQPIGDRANISVGSNISMNDANEPDGLLERERQAYYLRGGYKGSLSTVNLGVNYSKDNFLESLSYNASLQGGIALSKYGVDFSPDKINNTFAIVKFNNDIENVGIYGSSGIVVPSVTGRAVIPEIRPFRDNSLSVDTNYLPDDMYAVGGLKQLKPDYASVSMVEFELMKNKFSMFNIYYQGKPLDSGWYVIDDQGKYVTVIGESGVAGIEEFNIDSNNTTINYFVTNGNTQLCRFSVDYSKINNNGISSINCRK